MATPDFIKAPIALFTNFFLPHPKAPERDLKGKTMLVTGATPGSIGYESALVFSRWGARVAVTVRSESSRQLLMNQLENDNIKGIDIYLMDLENSDSVNEFVCEFSQAYESLDVLLNNAGVYFDLLGKWKEEHLSVDGEEIHWRINYLGVVQLTNALFPLLKKTSEKEGEARVVMVSSHMHDNSVNEELFSGLKPYKSVKAYGRSKLAIIHFSRLMHQQWFEKTKVKFICLHPGSVQANIVGKGLSESPLLVTLRNRLAWIERLILLSPVQGAQTQILCCSSESVESGLYYRRCQEDNCSRQLEDAAVSEKLWQQTQGWLEKIHQPVNL